MFGLFVIGCIAAPSIVQASILTFDPCGTSSGAILGACYGGVINPLYGDRISQAQSDAGSSGDRVYSNEGEGFTPNILTTINGAFGWGAGFGSLTNAIFADGYTGTVKLTFTPDPGYKAKILSFSMGAMLPPDQGFNDIIASVLDGSDRVLWSSTYTSFGSIDIHQLIGVEGDDGDPITLVFDLRALTFDPSSGSFEREMIGFDNIAFSQRAVDPHSESQTNSEVPESSTFFLAATGAGTLICRAVGRDPRRG